MKVLNIDNFDSVSVDIISEHCVNLTHFAFKASIDNGLPQVCVEKLLSGKRMLQFLVIYISSTRLNANILVAIADSCPNLKILTMSTRIILIEQRAAYTTPQTLTKKCTRLKFLSLCYCNDAEVKYRVFRVELNLTDQTNRTFNLLNFHSDEHTEFLFLILTFTEIKSLHHIELINCWFNEVVIKAFTENNKHSLRSLKLMTCMFHQIGSSVQDLVKQCTQLKEIHLKRAFSVTIDEFNQILACCNEHGVVMHSDHTVPTVRDLIE